jgi:hypothetical protein
MMGSPSSTSDRNDVLGIDRIQFYRSVMDALHAAGVPCLVGGAYALRYYTGIARDTKDLDLFLRPRDVEKALASLQESGCQTELTSPAWLAKASHGAMFVDLIYRSGNGMARVDDVWFQRAESMRLFDAPVAVTPIEESIWSKAFTMERERFDLADIVHLIQARGGSLDWQHLLQRFGGEWRVLLSHLTLFQYCFPNERGIVPIWVMDELIHRLQTEIRTPVPPDAPKLCKGSLLSGAQFLIDTLFRGYTDARFDPQHTGMTDKEIRAWKKSLDHEQSKRMKDAMLMPPAMKPA